MAVEITDYQASLEPLWPREHYMIRQARILELAQRNRWPARTRLYHQHRARQEAWRQQQSFGRPVAWVMAWDNQLHSLLRRYPPSRIPKVVRAQAAARHA